MNFKTLSFFLCISIFAFACKKHKMLNIDYPAAYVVSGQDNFLEVINLNDYSHKAHIELNGSTFPHHLSFNADKSLLAVAITGTDLSAGHAGHGNTSTAGYKAIIINSTNGMIEKEISLAKMPHNTIFSPSGNELWIGQSDTLQSSILVYETMNWSLQNTIPVGRGLSEVSFSTDGSMAFASNTMDGTVSLIAPTQKTIHTTLSVGQNPVGAWPASNGKMYVDNELSQTISEISVADMTITETITLNYTPAFVAFHTATSELWITDATNGKVHYYSYDTGMSMWMERGEFNTGQNAHAIAFDSNGKAYITNQGSNTLSIVNVGTHIVEQTISVGAKPNGIVLKQ